MRTMPGTWWGAALLWAATLGGCSASATHVPAYAPGGQAPPPQAWYPRARPSPGSQGACADRRPGQEPAFREYGTNAQEDTRDRVTSTFGIDVDDASFRYARGELVEGRMPEPEMVRVEEFVNHVDYGYARPREDALALSVDVAPSPFARHADVLRVALCAGPVYAAGPRHLVFALDTSGSMADGDRLSLVKYCVRALAGRLRGDDLVSVVGFADEAYVALDRLPAHDTWTFARHVDTLQPSGSTNVVEGLAAAYDLAARDRGGREETRVVLCSDGLANLASLDQHALLQRVRLHAARGIRLTVVGFGQDAINDTHLEHLAREGQGRYTYVREQRDIEETFGAAFLDSLHVVAEDVRVQVEFDPACVRTWRLLGYESRQLPDEDFRSGRVRSAHLEAGRSVTALYEIRRNDDATGDIATVRVDYLEPRGGDGSGSRELRATVRTDRVAARFEAAPRDLRLAACTAELAELMRGSAYARAGSYAQVEGLLEDLAWGTREASRTPWPAAREIRDLARAARGLRGRRSS